MVATEDDEPSAATTELGVAATDAELPEAKPEPATPKLELPKPKLELALPKLDLPKLTRRDLTSTADAVEATEQKIRADLKPVRDLTKALRAKQGAREEQAQSRLKPKKPAQSATPADNATETGAENPAA